MAFLRKYGTGSGADVYVPLIKRAVVDFAVTADWTPASGDVKISIDGGAAANIGTLPVVNGTHDWKFVFTDAELQGKVIRVRIVDSATKAVEDQSFTIETYGHASAMYKPDFSDSVRLGLTALPNAAADAAGGLPISDAGGLDLDAKLANTHEVTAARMGALTDWIDGGRLDLLLDATLADTNELQTDWANGGRLDLIVDGIFSIVEPLEIDTGTAQAGAASTLTLRAGSVATDGYYDHLMVRITGGTGSGQVRVIDSYVGSTKVATIAPDWSVTPDNTSTYTLFAHTQVHVNEVEAGAITAASFASDVDAEFLSYLVDDATRIDASALNTASGAIGSNGSGLTEAGGTGDHLTAVVWNAAWDAEVQSEVIDALQETVPDSVPADGTRPSVQQACYMICQGLFEGAISSTTWTVKKVDGSTTLFTVTLDSASTPTSKTRAT